MHRGKDRQPFGHANLRTGIFDLVVCSSLVPVPIDLNMSKEAR